MTCGSTRLRRGRSSPARTRDLPAKPNWYPRADVDNGGNDFVSPTASPELYGAEVSGARPAGTVVAFQPGTFHRGTGPSAPGGARFSMHLNYRPAAVEWGDRAPWADRSHLPDWYRFVARATPEQLALFGPPPGHPYWTPATLAGVALRYPEPRPDQVEGTTPGLIMRLSYGNAPETPTTS